MERDYIDSVPLTTGSFNLYQTSTGLYSLFVVLQLAIGGAFSTTLPET